tara:strand:+ start:1102 stop:1356 length:255 start_codon:yes stop_codon:yes gene_type:complete
MKKKTILMGLFTTIIYGIVISSMVSCTNPHRQVIIENNVVSSKVITVETLNEGWFNSGVHKISVDSSEYILVITGHGAAIIKHK